MRIHPLAAAAMMIMWCPGADAIDHEVHQKGRVFSVESLTVARGEPVEFLNDDTVPHNIMSLTPDNTFDLGSQMPGTITPVTFDRAGNVAVICAIHPRMHMTIHVND
jgi:plastocyanin